MTIMGTMTTKRLMHTIDLPLDLQSASWSHVQQDSDTFSLSLSFRFLLCIALSLSVVDHDLSCIFVMCHMYGTLVRSSCCLVALFKYTLASCPQPSLLCVNLREIWFSGLSAQKTQSRVI